MEPNETLSLISFFDQITILQEDVSTEQQTLEGYKVVKVTYTYNGNSYITKPLHYRKVDLQEDVRMLPVLQEFFEGNAYWLDHRIHPWPKGSGEAEVENTVINDMVDLPNDDFVSFLKLLANNKKTGALQKITLDGRSQQYGYNLENNNHWHDLVLLVKEMIASGGKEVDKRFYEKLIFNWYDGERSSLHKRFGARALIDKLMENIQKVQQLLAERMIIQILKEKNQVIFQGPPGTGKTRKALEVANELAKENLDTKSINKEFIVGNLTAGMVLQTPDGTDFTIKELTNEKVVASLSTGNTFPVTYDQVIKCITEDVEKNLPRSYGRGIGNYIVKKYLEQQITIIQFHPSYSYEDFVRGITVQNVDGNIAYRTENKVLAKVASTALENYIESAKNNKDYSESQWLKENLDRYSELVAEKILTDKRYDFPSDSFFIKNVVDDHFYYYKNGWFGDDKEGYGFKISKSTILNAYHGMSGKPTGASIDGYAPNTAKALKLIVDDFTSYLVNKPAYQEIQNPGLKNFVLIIDEINRANLSSVLGELIYGLEYRNSEVESMYEIDGNRKLRLPPNLFIIGTMNTADRSVGHIDYAIRRRFAFVEILPTVDPIKSFAKPLFKKVSELFISNFDTIDWTSPKLQKSSHLAPDFRPEDVWVGHSYFLTKGESQQDVEKLKLKLQYEIKPILREYLKDGILLESARPIIDELY